MSPMNAPAMTTLDASRRHIAREIEWPCAEREPHTELLRSSRNGVRKHSIQSDAAKQQRQRTECGSKIGHDPLTQNVALHLERHRSYGVEDEARLSLLQRRAHACDRCTHVAADSAQPGCSAWIGHWRMGKYTIGTGASRS